jgi:molybdopterin synthase sulfur carrier subunit
MTVRFFAYIREVDFAGCKEMTWPYPAATLRDLGVQMCEKFGAKFRGEFFTPDQSALGERIIVLVNGRRVEFTGGLDTPLHEGDTVQVFPVVAGG